MGFTLAELLISATVFSVVGLAIGYFYVFSIQSVDEGNAEIELQRNGIFAIEEMAKNIREGVRFSIPAEGEPPETRNSITIYFPSEPFEDENHNNSWDPGEFFQDLNANGQWDQEIKPPISFRLSGNALEYRIHKDGLGWEKLLDNRYGYSSGRSSVYIKTDELIFERDGEDQNKITIRLTIRDDMKTEQEDDDLIKNFKTMVRQRG
jgi:type II secretory pathway component PulJ